MARSRNDHRPALLALLLAVAALAAGCGDAGGAGTGAASAPPTSTENPLTVTIPASPLDPTLPAEEGTLRIAGVPSLAMDLWRVAAQRGYPAREGLRLQIRDDADAEAVADALASGSVDAAVVPAHVALDLVERGLLISLPMVLTASKDRHAIIAREGVEDVAGLAGGAIAVGSEREAELLARAAVAEAALAADAVAIVPAEDPVAGVRAGAVDAGTATGDEVAAVEEVPGDPPVAVLATAADHPGLLSEVLVMRDDALRERPGQAMALVRVWQDLYDADHEEPERLAVDLARVTDAPVEAELAVLLGTVVYDVYANAMELVPGGEFHDTRLLQVRDLSAEAGWIAGEADVREVIDWRPVQAVASAR